MKVISLLALAVTVHGFSPRHKNALTSAPRVQSLLKPQAEPLQEALKASRRDKGTMDRIKFKAKNASATATLDKPVVDPLREALRAARQDRGMMKRIKFRAKNASSATITEERPAPVAPALPKAVALAGKLGLANAAAASAWLGLIAWTCTAAPGKVGSSVDSEMLDLLIAQPSPRPESINELWYAVWNCFAVLPAMLAALTAPTGRGERLPAAPFLWFSSIVGFFALGPYFAARDWSSKGAAELNRLRRSDLGWVSRNIFESRIFGALLLGISVSIPFSSDLFAPGLDFGQTVAQYGALFDSSRFISVASVDFVLISGLTAVLVAEDAARREGTADKAAPIGAAALLLPVLGPALWLVLRPSLDE